MDPPKCQRIPSCGKKHYGPCATRAKAEPAEKARPKKKLKADNSNIAEVVDQGIHEALTVDARTPDMKRQALDDEFMARIESLEDRLAVLEKRKKYNRDYMRERRALESEGGE